LCYRRGAYWAQRRGGSEGDAVSPPRSAGRGHPPKESEKGGQIGLFREKGSPLMMGKCVIDTQSGPVEGEQTGHGNPRPGETGRRSWERGLRRIDGTVVGKRTGGDERNEAANTKEKEPTKRRGVVAYGLNLARHPK